MNSLNSHKIALEFVSKLIAKPLLKKTSEDVEIVVNGNTRPQQSSNKILADIYLPTRPYRGTILFVHGMSLAGKNDARMVHFSQVLQRLGFLVIMPEYPEIKATRLTLDSIENISQSITYFAQNKQYAPYAQMALIAPSFSAALAFKSIVNQEVGQFINSYMSIGGLAYMDAVVQFVLSKPTADPYATLIILKNFCHHVVGDEPEVKKAFEIAVSDNWHRKEKGDLHHYLETIQPRNKKIVLELIHNIDFRKENVKMILEKEMVITRKASFVEELEQINSAVFLLHGQGDAVIAADQSQIIYERLRHYKKLSKLVITPFLSHGDTKFQLNKIPALWKLINGFAFFFYHATRK